MNPSDPRLWLDVMQWIVTLSLVVSVWLRKPGTDAQRAVDALKTDMDIRLQAQSVRLVSIETHLEHLPSIEDLGELKSLIKQLTERSEGAAENMRNLRKQLDRIEDFLRGTR